MSRKQPGDQFVEPLEEEVQIGGDESGVEVERAPEDNVTWPQGCWTCWRGVVHLSRVIHFSSLLPALSNLICTILGRKKRRVTGGTRTIVDWPTFIREHPDEAGFLRSIGENHDKQRLVLCTVCTCRLLATASIISKHFKSEEHLMKISTRAGHPLRQQILGAPSLRHMASASEVRVLLAVFFMAHNIPLAKAEQLLKDGVLVGLCHHAALLGHAPSRKTMRADVAPAREWICRLSRAKLQGRFVSMVTDESRDNRGVRMLVVSFCDGEHEVVARIIPLAGDESLTAERLTAEKMKAVVEMKLSLKQVTADIGDNAAYSHLSIVQFAKEAKEAGGRVVELRCMSHGFNLAIQAFLRGFPELSAIASEWRALCSAHPGALQDKRKALINERLGTSSSSTLDYADTRWASKLKAILLLIAGWDVLCSGGGLLDQFKELKLLTAQCADEMNERLRTPVVKLKGTFVGAFLEPAVTLTASSQNSNKFLFSDLCASNNMHNFASEMMVTDMSAASERIRVLLSEDARACLAGLEGSIAADFVRCIIGSCRDFAAQYEDKLSETFEVQRHRLSCIPSQAVEMKKENMLPRSPPLFGATGSMALLSAWGSYVRLVDTLRHAPASVAAARCFWMRLAKKAEFKELGTLALRALSICTTNAGVERVFSVMNHMESSRRRQSDNEYVTAELLASTNRGFVLQAVRKLVDEQDDQREPGQRSLSPDDPGSLPSGSEDDRGEDVEGEESDECDEASRLAATE